MITVELNSTANVVIFNYEVCSTSVNFLMLLLNGLGTGLTTALLFFNFPKFDLPDKVFAVIIILLLFVSGSWIFGLNGVFQ